MRTEFESCLSNNLFLNEKYIADLENSAIFQHIRGKEEKFGKSACSVLEVAVAFKFYKNWINQREAWLQGNPPVDQLKPSVETGGFFLLKYDQLFACIL